MGVHVPDERAALVLEVADHDLYLLLQLRDFCPDPLRDRAHALCVLRRTPTDARSGKPPAHAPCGSVLAEGQSGRVVAETLGCRGVAIAQSWERLGETFSDSKSAIVAP